jgi:hypothetical protein
MSNLREFNCDKNEGREIIDITFQEQTIGCIEKCLDKYRLRQRKDIPDLSNIIDFKRQEMNGATDDSDEIDEIDEIDEEKKRPNSFFDSKKT